MRHTRTAYAGYGKLPLSREYVKIQVNDDMCRKFTALLDRHAATILQLLSPDATMDILFGLASSGNIVLGRIWPSADAGGQRAFPFSVFTSLKPKSIVPVDGRVWLGLAPHFEKMDKLARAGQQLASLTELHEAFDQVKPLESSGGRPNNPAPIALANWSKNLFPGQAEQFHLLLWALQMMATKSAASGQTPAGIKLPLAANHPQTEQVDGWLALLGKLLPRLPGSVDTVVINRPERAELIIFCQGISPLDFEFLVPSARASGFIDLTNLPEPASLAGFTTFTDRCDQLLAEGLTMDRFIDLFEESYS